MHERPIFLEHAADVGETFGDVFAIPIVQKIVDAAERFLQFDHAVIQINDQLVGGGSQSVNFVGDIGKADGFL